MEKCMVKTMFWVAIVAIIISVVSMFFPSTESEKSMLTFVGVLATFVVVGNYAQTADMRDRTESKMKELEGQLQEAKSQLGDAEKLNNELSETIENFKNQYEIVVKKELLRIVNKKGIPVGQSGLIKETISFNNIKDVLSEGGSKYKVQFSDGQFLVDIIEETAIKLA